MFVLPACPTVPITGKFTGGENVWNFHIGGYQVCHKWLKDRKGRTPYAPT
jgi:hypothetical protein